MEGLDLSKIIAAYADSAIAQLDDSTSFENVVFVIGKTQTGKSTYQNFLAGNNLSVEKKKIILTPGSKGLPIGNGRSSCTGIPNIIEIEDMTFIDCPGFGDTETGHEIPNAAYITRLASFCKNFKILLFAKAQLFMMDDLNARKVLYRNFFNFIGLSFSIEQLKQSTALVITQVDRDEEQDLLEEIQYSLDELELSIDEKSLVKCITYKPLLFYLPKGQILGNSNDDRYFQLVQIRELNYLQMDDSISINPVISDRMQKLLSDQMDREQQKAQDCFKSIILNLENQVENEFQQLEYQSLNSSQIIDENPQSQHQQSKEQLEKAKVALLTLGVYMSNIEILQDQLCGDQQCKLIDLQEISLRIQNWANNNNYTLLKKDYEKLYELGRVIGFFKQFKYCIKQLQDAFDFGYFIKGLEAIRYRVEKCIHSQKSLQFSLEMDLQKHEYEAKLYESQQLTQALKQQQKSEKSKLLEIINENKKLLEQQYEAKLKIKDLEDETKTFSLRQEIYELQSRLANKGCSIM